MVSGARSVEREASMALAMSVKRPFLVSRAIPTQNRQIPGLRLENWAQWAGRRPLFELNIRIAAPLNQC